QTRPYDGDWSPQLVCSISRKPPLHLHRFNQTLEADVDGGDQRLNLTRRLIDRQQHMLVLWCDLRSQFRNLSRWHQVVTQTGGACEEGRDADRRRRPGHVLEEVEELV